MGKVNKRTEKELLRPEFEQFLSVTPFASSTSESEKYEVFLLHRRVTEYKERKKAAKCDNQKLRKKIDLKIPKLFDEQKNCEKLISLVKERESLWNRNNILYLDKQETKRKWQEISESLNVSGDEARRKWANLRHTYRNHLNKMGYYQRLSKKVNYYDSMSFLQDHFRKYKEDLINPIEDDEQYLTENVEDQLPDEDEIFTDSDSDSVSEEEANEN